MRWNQAYLLPAVLAGGAALLSWRAGWRPQRRTAPHPGFAVLAVFALAVVARSQTGGRYFAADEFGYEFGARLNAAGLLCLPAPPMPEFFTCNNIFLADGRWFSLYPPGWTGLLGLGSLLALEHWVPPLTALAVVLALAALAREWEGPEAARWLPWLALLSPGFVLNGATLFSHLATALWTALALCFYHRASREPRSLLAPLLSGLALGMVVNTRTADGLLVGLALVAYHLLRVARREVPFLRPAWLLCPLGALLSGGWALVYNAQLSGDFFKAPYQTVGTVALASAGLLSYERLWHGLAALARLLVWQAPGLAEAALVGLRRLRSHDVLLLFLGAEFLVAYSGWPGQLEVSSRYLLLPALLLLIPAARTCQEAPPAPRNLALLAVAVLMGAGAYPGFLGSLREAYRDQEGQYVATYTPPDALIFRRTVHGPLAMASNRNDPWLRGRVSALFLEPERNRRLIRAMKRPAFTLDYQEGAYRLRHYDELRPLDEDLLVAGINLAGSVLDRERAEQAFLRVPVGSPYYGAARYNAARSALTAGDFEKAARFAAEAGSPAAMLEGEALRRLGRTKEARTAYERAAAALPPGPARDQAAAWARSL
jgi:hypothetical protein